MDSEEILDLLKRHGALLEGHFELRSGLHSDRYFQCARILQHPRPAEELGRRLADRVRAELGPEYRPDAVISPALGGIIIGHELARAFGVRAIFAEKEGGRLALRRSFEILPNERLVIAEDVVTRGGRVSDTMRIVLEHGGQVDAIAVIVDRSGGQFVCPCPVVSLVQVTPQVWAPSECPLCRAGIELVHPGS